MSNKDNMVSIEELIGVLRKTALPTVIIEGDDDVIALRGMEDDFSALGLSVFPVGGRHNVLALFQRRKEFDGKKLAFVADRDTWVMTKVPDEYQSEDLIFTHGYSIENDIYIDGNLECLMSANERIKFTDERDRFIHWYSLAVTRFMAVGGEEIKLHPSAILDDIKEHERKVMLNQGETYPEELRKSLSNTYTTQLRGKSLLALLIRQLSYKGRPVRHHHKQLIEQVASRRGPLIRSLFDKVGEVFNDSSAVAP